MTTNKTQATATATQAEPCQHAHCPSDRCLPPEERAARASQLVRETHAEQAALGMLDD